MLKKRMNRENELKKWNATILTIMILLFLFFNPTVVSSEIPELTNITITRGLSQTLYGKPYDTFVFSALYMNSAGLAPIFTESQENGRLITRYEGMSLQIGGPVGEHIPMKPERVGPFTNADWVSGIRFKAAYTFREEGRYSITFRAEDRSGNTKEKTYAISIFSEVLPFLEILKPSEGETIQGDLTIEVLAADYDGKVVSVTLNVAEQLHFLETKEGEFDRWMLLLPAGSIPEGECELRVAVLDNGGQVIDESIHIIIGPGISPSENLPPEINRESFDIILTDGMYRVSVRVEDDQPGNLEVILTYSGTSPFMERDGSSYFYDIDAETVKPGKQELTVTARDLGGNSVSEQFVVFILEKEAHISMFIVLLGAAVIIGSIYMFSFRKPKTSASSPELRELRKLILEDQRYSDNTKDLQSRNESLQSANKSLESANRSLRSEYETLESEYRNLKRENKELTSQVGQEQENAQRLQGKINQMNEGMSALCSQEIVHELDYIARTLPEDLASLYLSFADVIRDLPGLEFNSLLEKLKKAIDSYQAAGMTLTDREQMIQTEAKSSYEDAKKELRKAHGALDVKILELFLKKAYDLLEMGDRVPHEGKVSNYEASKRLSQEILDLLQDPQLTIRLRKLRELGYLDPLELS